MGKAVRVTGPNLGAPLPFADQVSHDVQGLCVAPEDVFGEAIQHWTDDGRSSLHLAKHRLEVRSRLEELGGVVHDEMQTLQPGPLGSRRPTQFRDVFVCPTA